MGKRKFCVIVGTITEEIIRKYIANQFIKEKLKSKVHLLNKRADGLT